MDLMRGGPTESEFYRSMVLNYVGDWDKVSDTVFRRLDYEVTVQETETVIVWFEDDHMHRHALPHARAIDWLIGIQKDYVHRERMCGRSEGSGGPPERELDLVRDIGFRNVMWVGAPWTETIEFYGPERSDGREEGSGATEKACLEFIEWLEHRVGVVRDYLAHGRNPRTHEWHKQICPVCHLEIGLRDKRIRLHQKPESVTVMCEGSFHLPEEKA